MEKNHAKEQARAQLASIHEMVARLEHARACEDESCEEHDHGSEDCPGSGEECSNIAEYHDEDDARDAMQRDALDVQVRSGWSSQPDQLVPEQYTILLCTGGPAVRIKGTLDDYNQPETAQLEYQDWGTPWTRYTGLTDEDIDALLRYAGCFYFGE